MKRYHGVSPLEQKRSMPAWLAKPSFVIGLLIVLVVILMALFPQFIAPYDPIATDVTVSNQAPSAAHWFGTDFYGRDIFSRVIWGTRIDLLIGVLGVVIPFLVGGMIGLLAGYYGGFLDSLLMRITDIMMAFPFTILVITIMAILGQGLINLFIALWLVGWMSYAKLVRSEVLVLKDSEFIQAARVAGFSDARILFRHLLPNVISSAVVFAASDVVMCMLTGASMSFLGLGVSPPTPEWGSILNEGRNFITFAWWPTLFPGLFLAVSGVGFSLLGDGLTDFLRTGRYDRRRPFYKTVSPSMDILVSSNLERLLYLLSGDDKLIADLMKQLSENGEYEVPADMLEKLHELFWAGFCDDEGAKTAIGKVWKDDHYLCDTHTAVAYHVLDDYRRETGDTTPSVVVSTASPFKFCDQVLRGIGGTADAFGPALIRRLSCETQIDAPAPLTGLDARPVRFGGCVDKAQMLHTVDEFLK